MDGSPGIGVVVEGGGLRGSFGVGVLAELATWGARLPLPITHLFATSSGAPNAAFFAAGQIEDGVRIWNERTHGRELIDFRKLVGRGDIMKIDELVEVFRGDILLHGERFAADAGSPELHVSVTNVETGGNEVLRANPSNVHALLTAAMAVPIAYGRAVPVTHADGHTRGRYIDGGFGAPVAVREAVAAGLAKILVVLTKPAGHRRKRNTLAAFLQGRSYPRHPLARQAIADKWMRYNATLDLLAELEGAGKVYVLRPPHEPPARRLSRSKAAITASIELGRATLREHADALSRYFAR